MTTKMAIVKLLHVVLLSCNQVEELHNTKKQSFSEPKHLSSKLLTFDRPVGLLSRHDEGILLYSWPKNVNWRHGR